MHASPAIFQNKLLLCKYLYAYLTEYFILSTTVFIKKNSHANYSVFSLKIKSYELCSIGRNTVLNKIKNPHKSSSLRQRALTSTKCHIELMSPFLDG